MRSGTDFESGYGCGSAEAKIPDWLRVVERPFPSATLVVVQGARPAIVDPGSATDADQLPDLLNRAGAPVDEICSVICSHYHSDHVGAVGALQQAGMRVAAHPWDAAMVNARDPQACAAAWLDQPVPPYEVDRSLLEGETIDTGGVELEVIYTPGHTLGSISLWEPDSRTLICGDALHDDDIPWIGVPHEGAGSIQRAEQSLSKIEALSPAMIVSGHGPIIQDPGQAIGRTRNRLAAWADDPLACVMYAAKRIFVYRLMLEPIPYQAVRDYLRARAWLRDLASFADIEPGTLIDDLLTALKPSLRIENDHLTTTAPHRKGLPAPWDSGRPERW